MVTPHPSRGTRDRVRARGGRLPLAHVLGRRCDAPVLRLGRVRGAIVRRRRRSPRRRCGRQASTTRRARSRGSGEQASGAGSRTRPCTRSQSSRASSSGDAIGFSRWRSSLGSARIPSTGGRSAHRDSPGVGAPRRGGLRRSRARDLRPRRPADARAATARATRLPPDADRLHGADLPRAGDRPDSPEAARARRAVRGALRVSPLPGRSVGRHGRRRPRRRRDADHRASLLPPDGAPPLRPRPTSRRPGQRRRRTRRVRLNSVRARSGAARR